jgi:hypothetical protein
MRTVDFTDDEHAVVRQAINEHLDPPAEIGSGNAILRSASKPARWTARYLKRQSATPAAAAATAGNTLLWGSVGWVSPAMEINMAYEFHPGETVPESGIYRVTHNARHITAEHEVTVIKGGSLPELPAM